MKTIKHSLEFITELDESNPTARKLLELDEQVAKELLNSMLTSLLVPELVPILDKLNKNHSYALLKVVE